MKTDQRKNLIENYSGLVIEFGSNKKPKEMVFYQFSPIKDRSLQIWSVPFSENDALPRTIPSSREKLPLLGSLLHSDKSSRGLEYFETIKRRPWS